MRRALVGALLGLLSAGPATAHDVYSGWNDRSGTSCCNDRDCAAVQACRVDGQDGWLEHGRCWPLPPSREVPPPPAVWERGDLHVCRVARFLGGVPIEPLVRCWAMARGA